MAQQVECGKCKHFNAYKDGETEPQFGEMVCTAMWWEFECLLKCKQFHSENPVICKKFELVQYPEEG